MSFRGRRFLLVIVIAAAVGDLPSGPMAATAGGAKSEVGSRGDEENVNPELLLRLKREYAEAGDDLDRKQQLIQWAVDHGREAVVALQPVALREGKSRLAKYLAGFQQRIAAAPKKNAASVLSVDPELKTHRGELMRFSEVSGKLRQFLDREKPDRKPAADAPDFETFLSSREQMALEAWKTRMGYQGLDDEEIVVIEQTNQVRRERGLRPLLVDPRLCRAARSHSQDMFERKFFSHESPVPGKKTVGDRAQLAGTSGGGENIYSGSSGEGAMKGWMKSEGHRNNILNQGYLRIGVGHFENRYTQMFGG